MTLTEVGAKYLARIEPLIEELDQAKDEALAAGVKPVGTIRLTASVAFGQKCIAPLLPKLRAAFPELGVDLILTDANADLVSEGIDLAIRLGPSRDSALIGVKLIDTRYRLCASQAYLAKSRRLKLPLKTPNDLEAHDCLLLNLPEYRSRWLFRDRTGVVTPVAVHGDVLISNPLVLLTCALEGMGPALLANWLVDEALASGELIDPFPGYAVTATNFETAAWLLYPSRSYLPTKVRIFIDFLREAFRPSK
jgi:DNA-binding transcriptional LysR family regulator